MDSGARAARAGLTTGDVVLEVNRRPVSSVEDLAKAGSTDSDGLLLLVARDGATLYLLLRG